MSCNDFDEGIPGICPPPSTCKVVHASTYANKVGVYPSDFLPSKRTIWHASFAANFAAAGTALGTAGQAIGAVLGVLGGGAGILGAELAPNLGQTIVFQSFHTIIFARTANRLNVAHVLTLEEIVSADKNRVVVIDVGEFVFEAVSVTDNKLDEETTKLTEQELEEIVSSGEKESDRAFRKLFEISIPNDRLVGIEFNTLGVEYRLDNGTDKERLALDSAGRGDLKAASYRDASSKKLRVDLTENRVDADGNNTGKPPKAGDILYLSYVAVREHYIRQNVNATWTVLDFGSQLECIVLLHSFKVQSYKFFEWKLEPDGGLAPRLAGWRIVETFNSRVNSVAPLGIIASESLLGDIAIGSAEPGIPFVPRIIPGIVTLGELVGFITDRSTMPTVTVNHTSNISRVANIRSGNINFHENVGVGGNSSAFLNADWYKRRNFSAYLEYFDTTKHILFNVHPKALRKRDLDKWGIERFLAIEVEKDVDSGKITFFPFMDDPEVDDPTSGANEYLDGSNFKLDPVLPLSRFSTGNFKGCCGSLGTFTTIFQLLSGGPDQNVQQRDGINTFHRFSSNIITEKFAEDTRVLVERNFPQARSLGPRIVAIDGAAAPGGAVSCIADPSKSYAFACHNNEDNFIVYNPFNMAFLQDSLRQLSFRPDQDAPPLEDNNNPSPEQFEPLLGFSGNAGDRPGRRPGQAVSIADYAPIDSFLFKTTNRDAFLLAHPNIPRLNVEEIPFSHEDNKIIVPTGQSYQGRLDIDYKLPSTDEDNSEILVLLKSGSAIEGAVDGLRITKANAGLFRVDMRWMRGDTIEIIGPRVKDMTVVQITVVGLDSDKASDFLNDPTPHTIDDKVEFNNRLTQKNLLFRSEVMSIAEDKKSILYIFFSDKDGGISVVSSNNFGIEWHYYYGIVEPFSGENIDSPFTVTHFGENVCFLFFLLQGVIFCKKVPFDLFQMEDANLIERFADRFVEGSEDSTGITLPKELASLYGERGRLLRRETLSYMAAGETSGSILALLGFDETLGQLRPFEKREIEIRNSEGDVETTEAVVRKNPIARGPRSAFTSARIDSLFFSAYRNDKGILRLWFLGIVDETTDPDVGSGRGKVQLQCHYSTDNGLNWYDQWEFIAYGLNRMRFDETSGIPFIDHSADGTVPPEEFGGTFPTESGKATFGLNIHWSRLKRDKIVEGELTADSESKVIGIESPYAFYQSANKKVFLFYVYQGCLLCKIFDDDIFRSAAERRREQNPKQAGMVEVRNIIEQSTRSHFVDGHLNQPSLLDELHDRYNADTDERLTDGNIIFRYQFAVEKFDDSRIVFAQRVCAHELPAGMVRVFYKFQGSKTLKSAVWTGREFWAEDFLKDKSKDEEKGTVFEFPEPQGGTPVTGGFGSEAF